MKVGDLVKDISDGDVGIITDIRPEGEIGVYFELTEHKAVLVYFPHCQATYCYIREQKKFLKKIS